MKSADKTSDFNNLGTAINNQVVADSFTHRGAELHFTGFDYDYDVPEPGTYGLLGAVACIGLVMLRWVRRRAAPTGAHAVVMPANVEWRAPRATPVVLDFQRGCSGRFRQCPAPCHSTPYTRPNGYG